MGSVPPVYRALCILACFLLSMPLAAQDNEIHVRLLEQAAPQALALRAEGGGAHLFAGDAPDNAILELAPDEVATIRLRGNDVYVQTEQMSFFALSLQLVPQDDALLKVEVLDDDNAPDPRHYPGRFSLEVDAARDASLKLINHLPLEQYVAHVVSREYGFDDLEGAKAMSVLARTYALHALQKYGDDYAQVDHRLAQQYDGANWLTPTAAEAVKQTRGQVLTYKGDLIEAVYFASSGGHTANNDAVWEGPSLPYLRGKDDPYDQASPHAHWESSLPRSPFLEILSETYGFEVDGFHIGDQSDDGRVQTIKLLKKGRPYETIRSNEFRLLVNRHFGHDRLKSTFFDAKRKGNRYVFEGQGYGHGVGLSQWGAHAMAQQGSTYQDILGFYYTDVSLQNGRKSTPLTFAKPSTASSTTSEDRPRRSTSSKRVGW